MSCFEDFSRDRFSVVPKTDPNQLLVLRLGDGLRSIFFSENSPPESVIETVKYFLFVLPVSELESVQKIEVQKDGHFVIHTTHPHYFNNLMDKNLLLDDVIPVIQPDLYDWVTMSFGKHKGLNLWQVFSKDPSYIKWLWENRIVNPLKSTRLFRDLQYLLNVPQVKSFLNQP